MDVQEPGDVHALHPHSHSSQADQPQLNFGITASSRLNRQHAQHTGPHQSHAQSQHTSSQSETPQQGDHAQSSKRGVRTEAAQHADAAMQQLTQALAESEQRAAAAELAVAAVQKACNEAVEGSTRLQVGTISGLPLMCP